MCHVQIEEKCVYSGGILMISCLCEKCNRFGHYDVYCPTKRVWLPRRNVKEVKENKKKRLFKLQLKKRLPLE